MKKEVAQEIVSLMTEYGGKIDATIKLVKDTSTNDEFEKYRSAAGKIMGYMLIDIMNPIFSQYPELTPKELQQNK